MTGTFVAADDRQFAPALPRRAAARLLLVDSTNRVLLLRHDPPLHDVHWAGPGGGLEPGEDAETALRREVDEELLLPCPVVFAPIGDWRHVFQYRGKYLVQYEALFAARLPAGTDAANVGPGPLAAADGIGESRWCDASELARLPDVWPAGLADWLRDLPSVEWRSRIDRAT